MKLSGIAFTMIIFLVLWFTSGCSNSNVTSRPDSSRQTQQSSQAIDQIPQSESQEEVEEETPQIVPNNDTIIINEYVYGLPYEEAMEIIENAGYTCIPSFILYDHDLMNGKNDRVEEIMEVYGFTDYNDLYGRVFSIKCRTGRQLIDHTGEAREGNSIFYARPGQSEKYDLVVMVFGTSEQYWSQEP